MRLYNILCIKYENINYFQLIFKTKTVIIELIFGIFTNIKAYKLAWKLHDIWVKRNTIQGGLI